MKTYLLHIVCVILTSCATQQNLHRQHPARAREPGYGSYEHANNKPPFHQNEEMTHQPW